jgi:hypothetical protein
MKGTGRTKDPGEKLNEGNAIEGGLKRLKFIKDEKTCKLVQIVLGK